MAKKTEAEATEGQEPTSKMGMVRAAMGALGRNAKPLAIQTHVKEKYNLDIPTTVISSYKNMIKNGPSKKGTGRRGRPAKTQSQSSTGAAKSSGGNSVAAELQLIQGLISRHGVKELHGLIDVLGK